MSVLLPKLKWAKSFVNKQKCRFLVQYLHLFIISLFITCSLINFVGCCAYSFTGASVPKYLKNISIRPTLDRSGSGEPGLGELFSSILTQKFVDDNTLQVSNKPDADATLTCIVTSLNDAPSVVSAGENVTSRRITIEVQVTYKDMVKRKTVFDKNYSGYADYASSSNIAARRNAIQAAIENITDNILLDTVSGW